jgi:hypothetical protein
MSTTGLPVFFWVIIIFDFFCTLQVVVIRCKIFYFSSRLVWNQHGFRYAGAVGAGGSVNGGGRIRNAHTSSQTQRPNTFYAITFQRLRTSKKTVVIPWDFLHRHLGPSAALPPSDGGPQTTSFRGEVTPATPSQFRNFPQVDDRHGRKLNLKAKLLDSRGA